MGMVQVVAAVRLALYHVGQLQRAGGAIQRFWQAQETDVMCQEMLQQADLMEPAPKLLLQVGRLHLL